MNFFNKNIPTIESKKDKKNIEKKFEIFKFIFSKIHYISINKKANYGKYIDDEFSPTIPKVIDNVIVGYIKEEKEREEEAKKKDNI